MYKAKLDFQRGSCVKVILKKSSIEEGGNNVEQINSMQKPGLKPLRFVCEFIAQIATGPLRNQIL